jgi:hypothetical protein
MVHRTLRARFREPDLRALDEVAIPPWQVCKHFCQLTM